MSFSGSFGYSKDSASVESMDKTKYEHLATCLEYKAALSPYLPWAPNPDVTEALAGLAALNYEPCNMCKKFVRTKGDGIPEPLGPPKISDEDPIAEEYGCFEDIPKQAIEAGTRRFHGYCMCATATGGTRKVFYRQPNFEQTQGSQKLGTLSLPPSD